MREIFDDIRRNQPLDPTEAARRHSRPARRRRFYGAVAVSECEEGFGLRLDGKAVRTPARRILAAPAKALAEAIAAEWRVQEEHIDPATMPLTRLANTIIDGVAVAPAPVVAEAEKYLATDLVFYRAQSPAGLVARQAAAWDPLMRWAHETLGACFKPTHGLAFVAQPQDALAAAGAAIPRDAADVRAVWRLGALHAATTLTGSALIALALLHGRLSVEEAWAAAHVDEDWNMEFWGRDELALERRAYRFAEMQAAAAAIEMLRERCPPLSSPA